MSKTKKIIVVYSFGFSKRNMISSGLIDKLIANGFDVDDSQDFYKLDRVSRLLEYIKYKLTNQLFYRFGYIKKFKKFLSKEKYRNSSEINKWDKINRLHGFPFPNSKILHNILHIIFKLIPSTIHNNLNADLILLTDLQFIYAQNFIKFANKKKIPVISINSSWDHLTHRGKVLNSKMIKKFLVWNEIQKKELIEIHNIDEQLIQIVGTLQFDSLKKIKEYDLKKAFYQKYKVSKDHKIIFLPAYNQRHGQFEPHAILEILKRKTDINFPFLIIIRPYPGDKTFNDRFQDTYKFQEVKIAENKPNDKDDYHAMSLLLKYADVVLTGASTAAIEAMFYDTPVIHLGIAPDQNHGKNYLFKEFFFSDHYAPIMEKKASVFAQDYNELINAINLYLRYPGFHRPERDCVIKEQVYFTDGQTSNRILENVNEIING